MLVSITPNRIVNQFQTLEESYQELQALRLRVRRAERANANATNARNAKMTYFIESDWPTREQNDSRGLLLLDTIEIEHF